MTINVPTGSTVLGAYLYTSLFDTSDPNGAGNTLNGNAVTYTTALGVDNGFLQAWRSDVTSIVKPIIGGGSALPYTFTVTEQTGSQDGEGLVVVYSDGSSTTQTVGILDGSSASAGDSAKINFSSPLDPTAPGFGAEMRLGIGFSYDGVSCTSSGQSSNVTVNGTLITTSAGCNDDSQDGAGNEADGNLITVGADGDPFSPMLPSIADDHERYNLIPEITTGDTSIKVDTLNPSRDDNIFLEVFAVTGSAGFNAPPPSVPEPGSLALLGAALAGFGVIRRRRKAA